ncbi:MAG: hypothetical protein HOG89_05150 [Candidatus Peribacter sp.]|jgi:hypothetical protein|nr:hypothetical protein [Candidatus Peribacter sp.]MBT4393210.1 hypothetical protein [Candidatus Peribacter sp.]MBT4600446.1 hypothetical protein [Candidatus Peribacter sp.]MBT5148578.1 hypothetical protein [Candidatus Peribacter sp.]MBT5637186.1 hypothetical protein [Candidatus Peribacter sp.]
MTTFEALQGEEKHVIDGMIHVDFAKVDPANIHTVLREDIRMQILYVSVNNQPLFEEDESAVTGRLRAIKRIVEVSNNQYYVLCDHGSVYRLNVVQED